ncbi:hypothetical protein BD414DRAFT_488732 [Trametes punicea]|nr:hypothetical protein BD414DRAFT_488732 [Trametes punicea]
MHLHHSSLLRPRACQVRCASTGSVAYPYPTHAHPTPHQIFHLPAGATQQQIKARYYELVRIHHPDSPFGRDISPASTGSGGPVDIYRAELERRRRARAAYEASRRPMSSQPQAWTASADDRWKDRIILFVGVLALGAGLGPMLVWPSYHASYQHHLSAAKNLAQARREAREFGEERRQEIRRRVQEYNELKAAQERPRDGERTTV